MLEEDASPSAARSIPSCRYAATTKPAQSWTFVPFGYGKTVPLPFTLTRALPSQGRLPKRNGLTAADAPAAAEA